MSVEPPGFRDPRAAHPPAAALLALDVAALLARPPVAVDPQTSIREAAQRMTRARVSSLLVLQGDTLVGLLTDRDLRSRCVAAGLDPGLPVETIMTRGEIETVGATAPAFEALLRMTRRNIHHLPVVDGQRVLGVLTTMDLAREQSANAVYLVGDIHKAASAEALAEIGGRVPGLQVQLVSAGASERQIGEVLATVNDAITTRLLELGEARLGAPPVRYAWVAGGSQGRREQTAQTDQDNALVLDDALAPGDDDYYAALARFVNDGLDACGLAYCPGEVMARNPKWRQPAARWRRYFDTWIETPERMALMLSSVFFDLRAVRGDARLLDELQRENLAKCRRNGIFLAHMTGNALSERPPLGVFGRFVLERGGEHAGRFDLKRTGILPVVHLARIYALAEGCAAVNTVERLRATAGTPTVSAEGARSLEDAYAYLGALRLRHQARGLRRGGKPDNFVAPGELSRLERAHLKDAFRIVVTMQQALERRYPARPPGS